MRNATTSRQTTSTTPLADELVAGAAAVLERVRTGAPRVHCITNAVAQNISANMLLALGAGPSMTIAPDEVGEFSARADALLVNLGTFDAERRAAAEIAIGSIAQANRPWVLDPVFIERSQPRTAFARTLVARHPSALRLNRAEFAALAGAPWSEGGLRAYAFETDAEHPMAVTLAISGCPLAMRASRAPSVTRSVSPVSPRTASVSKA